MRLSGILWGALFLTIGSLLIIFNRFITKGFIAYGRAVDEFNAKLWHVTSQKRIEKSGFVNRIEIIIWRIFIIGFGIIIVIMGTACIIESL
jgi:hypothetical protein